MTQPSLRKQNHRHTGSRSGAAAGARAARRPPGPRSCLVPNSGGPLATRAFGARVDRATDGRISPVIKYVYEIDYPPRGKDEYLTWVRSIADALQAPAELRRVASYDNVYSATPHRVVEFTFDSPEDAARYFDREEIGLILRSELPAHSANIRIKVLVLRDDYTRTPR